jgi:hypothetical protein
VIAPAYGRVEVKCRQLPPGGRIEERVEVSAAKLRGFDHLAVVIFELDFNIKGATVVPYEAVWDLVVQQRYNRVTYFKASKLPGAVDVSNAVRAAAIAGPTSSIG